MTHNKINPGWNPIMLSKQKKKPNLKTIMVFNFDHFTFITVDSIISDKRVCPDWTKEEIPCFFFLFEYNSAMVFRKPQKEDPSTKEMRKYDLVL